MRTQPCKPFRAVAAFTLVELIVAVGIFAVGASIAYPLLVSDFNLYIRNFSINKSNNSLRYGLQNLKKDIEMSLEPPTLTTYSLDNTQAKPTGVLTPLPPTAASGEAILLWVNFGPAYDMIAGTGPGGVIDPTGPIALNCAPGAPIPVKGDRLIILYPVPATPGMRETVLMNKGDTVSIVKPGRTITSVTFVPPTSLTVTIDDKTNPLPAGITGNQSVYFAREVAYAAYTINDTFGNAVERQLVCYPNTTDMTTSKLLTRDLDPNPQTLDGLAKTSTLAFNYPSGGKGSQSALSVNFPVRAVDYAHAIADRDLGGQPVDTFATEFNVFLRSNPQMAAKLGLY